jgi:dipeptidyl aminopeptidase/acylaminoacyl peptidase
MSERQVLPYGSWPSPITIEMATGAGVTLREPRLKGSGVRWIEGRPQEDGRQVIVRAERGADGATRNVDLVPPPYNARNMVHEYGGGSYAGDFFTNLADGRIYRVAAGGPQPLTAAGPFRYADLVEAPAHARILCVQEDHSALTSSDGHVAEPVNRLVSVDIRTGAISVLAEGHDFYSTPRPSPDGGERLAWLAWNHPNMPWDGCELWVADVDVSSQVTNARVVAGGSDESIVQPEWRSEHELVFASDVSGWWNLYALDLLGRGGTVPLLPTEAEFGGPQWVFGMRWYGIAGDGTIVAVASADNHSRLWRIPADGSAALIDVPDEQIESVVVEGSVPTRVGYLGAGPTEPKAVVVLDPSTGEREVVRRSFELEVERGFLSRPETLRFPTSEGDTAYAVFYPPNNRDYDGPRDERPPLVVMSHGGPTSSAGHALDLQTQLFTSRGFAVVDVDYRGSSGYGREYRRRLEGKWGIYDVDDCVAAARYLAERGDVDPQRMAIRGGSAGGYTTLCALTFHDVFAAGASYYGVGDLEALARDTHKFESRYIDRLVAPYPERIDVFHERSPIRFVEQLSSPLIVLQGTDDKVVPVTQAEQIVDALRRQRIPHAYLAFEGEGHGFRQAHNIRRSIEAELSFYAQVFGFELADPVEPVAVAFLDERQGD